MASGVSTFLSKECNHGLTTCHSLLQISSAMSHRNLPVLFINLGGEMIYIIDARLKAQMVEKDRANKASHYLVEKFRLCLHI